MTRKGLSYHQQRTAWPLLVGFIVFLMAHNGLVPAPLNNCATPAFIAYVLVGIFYDWLIFDYFGYKDSHHMDSEVLKEKHAITLQDVDKMNEFFVMARRAALAAAVSSAALCFLEFPNASLMGTFFFSYCGITILLISIGSFRKEIVFKYALKNIVKAAPPENPFEREKTSNILSDNPAFNPYLWLMRK